jgi:hypothetical protein
MLEEQAFFGASISRTNCTAALLDSIDFSAMKSDSLSFTLHLLFNHASKSTGNSTIDLSLSPSRNSYYLLTTIKSSFLPYITLRINPELQ